VTTSFYCGIKHSTCLSASDNAREMIMPDAYSTSDHFANVWRVVLQHDYLLPTHEGDGTCSTGMTERGSYVCSVAVGVERTRVNLPD